jgi:hypothetical protein
MTPPIAEVIKLGEGGPLSHELTGVRSAPPGRSITSKCRAIADGTSDDNASNSELDRLERAKRHVERLQAKMDKIIERLWSL